MINLASSYANTEAPTTGYPRGAFKNKTAPSATDGTPLEKTWTNDLWGFSEALVGAAGITPSGSPDTATASDRLDALRILIADANNPIGTIRAFAVATDPATLLGIGTWSRIGEGRTLIDCGTTYLAGSTGGEATHVLTTNEIPSHTHPIGATGSGLTEAGNDYFNPLSTVPGVTGSTGGGLAHNNLPPYLAAYIWRRVS